MGTCVIEQNDVYEKKKLKKKDDDCFMDSHTNVLYWWLHLTSFLLHLVNIGFAIVQCAVF